MIFYSLNLNELNLLLPVCVLNENSQPIYICQIDLTRKVRFLAADKLHNALKSLYLDHTPWSPLNLYEYIF